MFIRVRTSVWREVMDNVVSKPQLVNFTIRDNKTLLIEAYEPILQSEPVEIQEVVKSDDNYTSITVMVNLSFRIIDTEFVELRLHEELLEVRASDYTATYQADYEARIDIRKVDSDVVTVNSNDLERISGKTAALRSLSKVLKVEHPAIIVKDNTAFYILSNVAYITPFVFPDSIVSIDTLMALNQIAHSHKLTALDIQVAKDHTGYCVAEYGNDCSCAFNIKYELNSTSDNVLNVILKCKKVLSTQFGSLYEKVKLIERTFKQIKTVVTLFDGGICVNCGKGVSNSLMFGYGDFKSGGVTFETNIFTMSTICRVFGSDLVEVKVDGRYLCLQTATQRMLLTGTLH